MVKIIANLIIFLLFLSSCSNQIEKVDNSAPPETDGKRLEVPEKYQKLIHALEPFSEHLSAPKQGEWLKTFKESGQTFEQYINQNPTLPTSERNILYIQPLGNFSVSQSKIIDAVAEYLSVFYGLPVKLFARKQFEKPMRLANRRLNSLTKNEQIKTGYILGEILKPELPDDAAALIAFTNEDLFPDQNFNYVFGQASLENRVGVWSLSRLNPENNFLTFLKRTLKIAAHETGHMFSIQHCAEYKCVMNGSMSLFETDQHPLDACPEDTAKIYRINDKNPAQRYLKLAEFCRKYGLTAESQDFENKSKSLKNLD